MSTLPESNVLANPCASVGRDSESFGSKSAGQVRILALWQGSIEARELLLPHPYATTLDAKKRNARFRRSLMRSPTCLGRLIVPFASPNGTTFEGLSADSLKLAGGGIRWHVSAARICVRTVRILRFRIDTHEDRYGSGPKTGNSSRGEFHNILNPRCLRKSTPDENGRYSQKRIDSEFREISESARRLAGGFPDAARPGPRSHAARLKGGTPDRWLWTEPQD